MPTSKEYLNYILEQLSEIDGVAHRAMMGEYLLYYREKIIGGIYDNRLLIRPTESARALMPSAAYELPYQGGKKMLLVDRVEDRGFLKKLLKAVYEELPAPSTKGKNRIKA